MKELFFASAPGSVFVFRYYPKPKVPQLFGLFLMEIAPYLVATWCYGGQLSDVLLGFLLMYSVYEIGYIHNDLVAKKEVAGRTDRDQFSNFRSTPFLIVRFPVIAGLAYIFCTRHESQLLSVLLLLTLLLFTFCIHNLMLDPRKRVATFLVLNAVKILVRLVMILPVGAYIVLAGMPHLIVKLLHYLKAKGLMTIGELEFRRVGFYIYIGFFPLLLAIDPRLFAVSLPYFLNHNKVLILERARPLMARQRR